MKKKAYDVFISHTKKLYETELLAMLIKIGLENNNYNCFFDIENLTKITQNNLNKIINECKCYIIIIDKHTFNSKYVIDELKHVLRKKIHIIPIIDTHHVNMRKFIKELRNVNKPYINDLLKYQVMMFNINYRTCFINKIKKRIP